MKIYKFKEVNVTYAENQKPYLPLPALKDVTGQVISCWKMNIWERIRSLFVGKIWIAVQTFNMPLQPQFVTVCKKDLIPESSQLVIKQLGSEFMQSNKVKLDKVKEQNLALMRTMALMINQQKEISITEEEYIEFDFDKLMVKVDRSEGDKITKYSITNKQNNGA
jgi:hypothetical protein